MNSINFITIIAGAVLIVLVIIIEIFYLRKIRRNDLIHYRDKIQTLVELRHDLLPHLIEIYREYEPGDSEIMEKLIEVRHEATHLAPSCGWQNEIENKLNHAIKSLIAAADSKARLNKDMRFLQIKKEIIDLSQIIANLVTKYNKLRRRAGASFEQLEFHAL